MSVPRTHSNSCDLTVQSTVSTLHIPASHTFIPFQQFSITDGSGLRNPSDDNNNKAAVPVVSVVTAVSGLCPAIPVVSMQQSGQLAQAVVAPTIIPTVVTPITVQTANNLPTTTTMTVANTLNISNHISLPVQQQQQVVSIPNINVSPQTSAAVINNITTTPASPVNKTPSTGISLNTNGTNTVKQNTSNSKSTSNSQAGGSEPNEDLVKPVFKDGELVLEVECGQNKAILYLSKLCQGSKGPCISFQNSWLTPNEFQFVSGRETAKDWKRSIRHHGKSLKLLLAKGILNVHPTMCDCDGCRQGATLTRKGEKRRIPNGERKPRKPSSTPGAGSSDGNSGGAFRPVGSATITAQLTSPGPAAAKQGKPDVKRSAGDKPKMAATGPQSAQKETAAGLVSKTSLPAKPASIQRPSTLNPTRDPSKDKPVALTPASTSPIVAGTLNTPVAATTPLTDPIHAIPMTGALTPSRTQHFPGAVLVPPGSATSSNPVPTPVSVGHLSPYSVSTPVTISSSATPLFPVKHPVYPSSCLELTQQAAPSKEIEAALVQATTTECSPTDQQAVSTKEHPQVQASGEEDFPDDRETAEHEHIDDRADDDDDDDDDDEDIGDEHSDNMSNDSDCDYPSDDQTPDAVCSRASLSNPPVQQSHDEENDMSSAKEIVDVKKEDVAQHRTSDENITSEIVVQGSVVEDKRDLLPEVASSPALQPPPPTSATTLAQSTYSSACMQPLSVSVSTTNVKSEHIWVPPTLSPSTYTDQIHRNIQNNSMKSPCDTTAHKDTDQSRIAPHTPSSHNKASIWPATSGKSKRPSELADLVSAAASTENVLNGGSPSKEFLSIERQLAPTNHHVMDSIKRDSCETPQAKPLHTSNIERSNREREERHKQRVKEDRSRKEREEKNRKDKEREERREEKDLERRRHEEKERRELAKAQAESVNSKDMSTPTPSVDASRRPPGGVAEAAAFSDYMRVLAAGHGNAFMSPALTYMPTLFPARPQEASMAYPLLHPLSAFGPHLNSIPKDPMQYQSTGGALANYGAHPYGHLHPLLQRPPYTNQQSLLDYQRSLQAASQYTWPAAYPYFLHDAVASTSSTASSNSASALAAGVKRPTSEMEAAVELSVKRMRLEGRPPEYTSPWDYFTAAALAAQNQRAPTMAPSLPCGLESASMDKTWEYLRKRYIEYGPQAAAYLSSLPEYARPSYYCACADHRDDNIRMWNVEEVCKFLSSLDGCAAYAEHFREQRVTGRILALLSPDHLVKNMGMALGPAVQLFEAVAKKLQDVSKMFNCEACRNMALTQTMHPMALPL